jgi:hypothetical protein
VDIRKQWERLMVIASRMLLRYDLSCRRWVIPALRRSTATTSRWSRLMRELVLGWRRPDIDVPSVAAADLFGAEHSRICEVELPLAS